MSRTFAGESIFNGFDDRLTFPVATAVNAIPSACATRASRLSSLPIRSTSRE